ncbi:hypothetical protein LIER_37473 [Lithospermum erythrorhizon]|uniref:Uncharacterized protein n=1 Tax=Lithospermum erythrorhizon TaxID=34254 RepID=A0AAV3PM48_LITER
MVTRSKTRAKARGVALPKDPSPKECAHVPIDNGPSPGVIGGVTTVDATLSKWKGLKEAGKAKAFVAWVQVVSPNSFDVLNGPGEISGTKDVIASNIQMDALASSACVDGTHDKDGGMWQHMTRKGNSNGRGGAASSSVSPCG